MRRILEMFGKQFPVLVKVVMLPPMFFRRICDGFELDE